MLLIVLLFTRLKLCRNWSKTYSLDQLTIPNPLIYSFFTCNVIIHFKSTATVYFIGKYHYVEFVLNTPPLVKSRFLKVCFVNFQNPPTTDDFCSDALNTPPSSIFFEFFQIEEGGNRARYLCFWSFYRNYRGDP